MCRTRRCDDLFCCGWLYPVISEGISLLWNTVNIAWKDKKLLISSPHETSSFKYTNAEYDMIGSQKWQRCPSVSGNQEKGKKKKNNEKDGCISHSITHAMYRQNTRNLSYRTKEHAENYENIKLQHIIFIRFKNPQLYLEFEHRSNILSGKV